MVLFFYFFVHLIPLSTLSDPIVKTFYNYLLYNNNLYYELLLPLLGTLSFRKVHLS